MNRLSRHYHVVVLDRSLEASSIQVHGLGETPHIVRRVPVLYSSHEGTTNSRLQTALRGPASVAESKPNQNSNRLD